MDRLRFMGSTLFIPIFLVSVGVLLEPKVMVDPKTLLVRSCSVAVLGGKSLRPWSRGAFHSLAGDRRDVRLSGSQAAAT